jgi:hypothetical protein
MKHKYYKNIFVIFVLYNLSFMPKKRLKLIFSGLLIAIVFLNFLALTHACQAGTLNDLENQMKATGNKAWGSAPTAGTTLPDIIQLVISAFLGLLGIIFIVLIIYSGFNWMTAGGDEEKVTLAKNTLTRAVIGLIIIVAAYSITYFVFTNLPGSGAGGPLGGSGCDCDDPDCTDPACNP